MAWFTTDWSSSHHTEIRRSHSLLTSLTLLWYTRCMPCFVHLFLVSAVQKLLKSIKIWQSCSQIHTAAFYELRQKCRFSFFQVRCTDKLGNVINFITVACRMSLRLKWYKNCKNWLRLAKVIVKNKMSRSLWFTVYNVIRLVEHFNSDTVDTVYLLFSFNWLSFLADYNTLFNTLRTQWSELVTL